MLAARTDLSTAISCVIRSIQSLSSTSIFLIALICPSMVARRLSTAFLTAFFCSSCSKFIIYSSSPYPVGGGGCL